MPDPATEERLRGLILSAQDLRALTEWPDPLIEDYLNIIDNFITIAGLLDIEIDQKIEEIPTDFTDGSIPFADGGFLIEENPGLAWDNVGKILTIIGTIIATDLIATATTTSPILYGGDATTEDLELHSNPIKDGIIKLGDNSYYDESTDILNLFGGLITGGKREKNEVRITSADSPYTVLATDHVIFGNTDGGAIEIDLPAGVSGREFEIYNTGSSGNNIDVDPNGTEQIFNGGAGVAFVMYDTEGITIKFNSTDHWR
jgi:hypothetical protein